MSLSLSIKAFAGKNSPEFQKHFKAVQFCIENELSYPKETSEFFKGKLNGSEDLEDYTRNSVINYIKNGIEVDLKINDTIKGVSRINVSDIPKEVDEIVIRLY